MKQMNNLIHKVEELKDKFRSNYAMEENAYGKAIDDAIDVIKNFCKPDVSSGADNDKPLTECMAGRDSECNHPKCPVTDEDEANGRYCTLPLFDWRQ